MRFCSLFSALLTASRLGEAPDPAAVFFRHYTMPVRNVIYPVLDSAPIISGLEQLVNMISQVNSSDSRYGEHLDQCQITHVAHYRSKSSYAHEVLVLRMEYTAEDKSIETRFFRLERFRVDTTQDAARSGTRGWSKLSFDAISAASQSTEPRDSVRVSDQLSGIEGSVLPKDYKLVCEFNVATGTITLLEALVIADTLSKRLIKYSNLVHMCQFSTANLFLILKAIASERQGGDLDIQNGPAMREAGSFAGLALVNAHTGRPEPAFLSATDAQLKKMCSSMLHRRVAEEKANLIMGMIRADIQLLSGVVIGDVASSGASENDVSPGSIGPQAREAFEALRTQIRTKCESIKATASVPAQ